MHVFYEMLPHTADAAVRVRGDSWPGLLRNAARAFYDVMTDWESVGAGEVERAVELEAGDRVELLVTWLAELVYLYEVERVLFGRVDFDLLEEDRLRARLGGERFDESRHRIKTEVKAVTYHGASVEERDGLWTAEVVFDL